MLRCEGSGTRKSSVFSQGTARVEMAEDQGRRKSQEDALIAINVPEFKNLSHEDRVAALSETVSQLSAEWKASDTYRRLREEDKDPGTTVNGVIAWKEGNKVHYYSAQLGDSVAYVSLAPGCARSLNAKRHTVNEERKRIGEESKEAFPLDRHKIGPPIPIGWLRLDNGDVVMGFDGSLSVARAIGDEGYVDYGLSHRPDIESGEIDLADGGDPIFVVACDGLVERREITPTVVGTLAHKNRPADALVNGAMHCGSADNVSVATFGATTEVTGAFVFDGHGGSEASDFCANNFYGVLQAKIKAKIEAKKSISLTTPSGSAESESKANHDEFVHTHSKEYVELCTLIGELKKEIESCWPYPNKDRKKIKVDFLSEIKKRYEADPRVSLQQCLEKMKTEYKTYQTEYAIAILGGRSTRTRDLLNKIVEVRPAHQSSP